MPGIRDSALARRRNYTGLTATLAFAFCAWLSVAGANVALALLAVAFFLDFPVWSSNRRGAMFWLVVAFLCLLAACAFSASAEFPETSRLQYKDTSNWLKLLAFLPVAWWLRSDPRRVEWVWLSAAAGLVIGMLMHADWRLLATLNLPERTGFHLRIIFSGLAASTLILGLLLFAPRFLHAGTRSAWLKRTGWFVLLFLAGYMLLATLSRGAWLSALAVIPITVLLRYRQTGLPNARNTWLTVLAAIAVLGLVTGINAGKVRERLWAEKDAVSSIAGGHTESLPEASVTFRFNVQAQGLRMWLERPWLGWGPGTTEYLLAHSNNPALLHPHYKGGVGWMDHLHNTYLELLLRFGVLGFTLIGALVFLIARGLVRAHRSGLVPHEHLWFLTGAFGLLAIWSLFDFRALHADWRAYWILLAGSAYSYALHPASVQTPRAHR